jgi:hypothetical protein
LSTVLYRTLNFLFSITNDLKEIVRLPQGSASNGLAIHRSGPASFTDFLNKFSASLREVLTYQRASRFWTFQCYEETIFVVVVVVVVVLLGALSYWCVRRRIVESARILLFGSGLDSAVAGRSLQGSTGPKNVACGIDVGVVTVTALTTSKLLLADPVTSVDVMALGTRLTGVARIHAHYCPTGALSLVGQ